VESSEGNQGLESRFSLFSFLYFLFSDKINENAPAAAGASTPTAAWVIEGNNKRRCGCSLGAIIQQNLRGGRRNHVIVPKLVKRWLNGCGAVSRLPHNLQNTRHT
jgi:hypothetical protein